MEAPRIRRSRRIQALDYSPTEVAELDLLKLKRPTIYKWIKLGVIQTIKNEQGQYRITEAEIQRLQKLWKITPETMTRQQVLQQSIRREMARGAGKANAAKHSPHEIAAPMIAGRIAALEREVDPEGVLPADERRRRALVLRESQLCFARARRGQKQLLREQYGQEPA